MRRTAAFTLPPAIWARSFCWARNPLPRGPTRATFFDAKNFSRWGRAEVRNRGGVQLLARSGNVDNPDRNWSAWQQVDLKNDSPIPSPSARFLQWKAVLRPGNPAPVLDSVTVNYLPKNVAPEVQNVTVIVGARVPSGVHSENESPGSNYEPPIPTVKDRGSIAVRWKAHDDNGDDLVYGVYYRGDGETRWKLLRSYIDERYSNFNADLFPDGGYQIRVVASDSPSHSAADALTGEATSPRFEVDNTPPQIEALSAKPANGKIRVSFRAVDSFSPISRAEYSIDAGDWQVIDPVDLISDSKTESYDFQVALSPPSTDANDKREAASEPEEHTPEEHTIVVRAYDRFDNMGSGKVVVKAPALP